VNTCDSIEAVGSPRAQRTRINPFEVGRPVFGAGTAFFGRQEELSKILARLAKEGGTHPLALRGPRRIGKSSLLRELEAILDHPGEEGRTLNLAPELQSAIMNVRPVVASLQRMERVERGDEASFARFLRGLLRDVCRRLDLDAAPIESVFEHDCATTGVAYAFMIQMDQVLLRRPDQRLVVLLDELDEVFQPEFREVAGQLRHIIETQKRVSWIAATTRLVPSATGTYGSPWFNLLEIIDIRAMDWRSATQLVRQLGGKAGFEWSAAAVTAVLDLTGQRPYLLQLLGARVTDDLSAVGHDSVDSASVAAAANRLLDEASTGGSYLGYVWHEAQWLGRLIQWAVDRASGPISLLDISWTIRDEAATRGLALSGTKFDAAFDERISWLTQIADVMEVRSGQMNYAIPLTQRLVHEMLGRTEDFTVQAIQGLDQELRLPP
jgi:hypothetical protein